MPIGPPMVFEEGERFTHENHPRHFAMGLNPHQGQVRVQYLGCSGFRITDGTTNLLVDPYFSRPALRRPRDLHAHHRHRRRHIAADPDTIEEALAAAGIERADALLVTHTHYDHALDVAEVFRQTQSPDVYGSPSLWPILNSYGIAREHFHQVDPSTPHVPARGIGQFTVHFLRARHIYLPIVNDELNGPVSESFDHRTAIAADYQQGSMFSILITHRQRGSEQSHSLLIQGSANYIEGYHARMFGGRSPQLPRPDVMILGIGGVGARLLLMHLNLVDVDEYYRHVIWPVRPRWVLFSHWDDYNLPLSEPLEWYYQSDEVYDTFCRLRNGERHVRRSQESLGHGSGSGTPSGGQTHQRIVPRRYPWFQFLPLWKEVDVLPARTVMAELERQGHDPPE